MNKDIIISCLNSPDHGWQAVGIAASFESSTEFARYYGNRILDIDCCVESLHVLREQLAARISKAEFARSCSRSHGISPDVSNDSRWLPFVDELIDRANAAAQIVAANLLSVSVKDGDQTPQAQEIVIRPHFNIVINQEAAPIVGPIPVEVLSMPTRESVTHVLRGDDGCIDGSTHIERDVRSTDS